ncbi:glycoside hydrolase family 125 protein, partial [Candidatus Bathyarchaeota archaeon]|nr:glycoside hydrolase family 125 protein [Candidatus Bathyarchaeota archaeon]
FQAPPESGIAAGVGSGGSTVRPPIDTHVVSTCNFELDSFGAFLQLSADYFSATGDLAFFGGFQWVYAVQSLLAAARNMTAPTYDDEGKRLPSPYTFNSNTRSMTATLNNVGTGNPVARTGMVRSPFRPSDDAGVFEFLVPANMMFERYLKDTAVIMEELGEVEVAEEMRELAGGISRGISDHAVVQGPGGKRMYAYEVDGFGGRNLMDDANLPSLLSAPLMGYVDAKDEVYQATREFVLGGENPWFAKGPVISGVGSTHVKPGAAWPMASIVRIMTSEDDGEIEGVLGELVSSTAGLGLMHESVNSYDETDWTREW